MSEDLNERYLALLEQCFEDPTEVNFSDFRNAWIDSDFFDPVVDVDGVAEADDLREQGNLPEALDVVIRSLMTNPFQPRLLGFASRICAELDDPGAVAHFDYMHTYDITTVLESGDGERPESAFRVVCVPEEYGVADMMDLTVTEQALVDLGDRHFDRLTCSDSDGTERTLWFDVTDLMRATARAAERGRAS